MRVKRTAAVLAATLLAAMCTEAAALAEPGLPPPASHTIAHRQAAYPPCQGTFPSNGVADITVQSSPSDGIPWSVQLRDGNANLGVVTLAAQIYADNRQANVYSPHTQGWDYIFHGPLPQTFQVIGGGTYSMHFGSTVSFLFHWYSAAQPTRGGYAYLTCIYGV